MAGMQRHYKLRSSRFLVLLVVSLGVGSLLSLWKLPLPVGLLFAVSVVVLSWAGYSLMLDAKLRMEKSCVSFRLENQEEIVLVLRCGSHMPGRVLTNSVVTPYIVIMEVVLDEQLGRRSILILPDAMSPESFRHLRTALRWGDKADSVVSV
jgi:uncharacterized membrane protein AbrB (regulator of aidB expression)